MHKGKGMKFVGDTRVPKKDNKNVYPPDYSEYPGKTEPFWPDFLLKEWMVGAVFLVGYLILTIAHPSPLEGQADPTNTSYIPMPDWYFLFLYQLLKYEYASGPYNTIGAIVIPAIAIGSLMLAPFLDRGPERKPLKRPLPVAFMLLTLASMVFLTWESVVNHDWAAAKKQGQIVKTVEINQEDPGYKVYAKQSCINCHGDKLQGGAGPALTDTGLSADEIANIAHKGIRTMPAGQYKGSDEDLQKLAKFISGLKAE
ncbi:menaquinol-cytochrome c reductase cytochrome b/c subunit [Rummeliibacillus suwonensis]|jgi:menaquinol-cytochrome c reductase cytochrome b/c subunit|uniref:menaquinol-cytochrome c reductase cytochrome b/c subunit n=1 Tax=Rummeliibacillus suwonensis TaxID=1306154 RepID=UPI0011B6A399|nr:menaquinol-cytochrome c reductase cytochrome b/c subunit [Rummeliibacillus suwonensis]MBO2534761.1 c-type cytochrome [Rummeliibacillus suwonensis]